MITTLHRYLSALLLLPLVLSAQDELHYKRALEGYRYVFPRDHGSHSEFKLEWWYYTGHVRSADGREFGYELTFFRNGMDRVYSSESAWLVRDLYMAHFAVTDLNERQFYYFEKINRAGPGIAGAAAETLHAWNENWSARLDAVGAVSDRASTMRLTANAGEAAIELTLEATKAPAIHGNNGVSQKAEGAGHASHYYSLTRLATSGTVRIGGARFMVTGESWMDHEFGTSQLADNEAGWDWLGIQLDNGVDIMLYRMRHRDGGIDPYSSGTIIEADSKTQRLRYSEFSALPGRRWKSPATGTAYPVEWMVSLPGRQSNLVVKPAIDNQELVTTRSTGIAYWEGAVDVSGTWDGKPVKGRGYLELTGYSEQHRPRI